MANIPGTNVAAMIVPFDDQDVFATHNDKYGRGGFRVCNTIAERDGISSLRRKAGMWVKVLSDDKIYELGADETNASWREFTFNSNSSMGGIDGGYAATIYTGTQPINGGGAGG